MANRLVCALERSIEDALSLFLAGPSPRGHREYDWRQQACAYREKIGFDGTVCIPLPRDGRYHENYDYAGQIDWELEYLDKAGAIAIWIPRDLKMLPGFTINVEFGRFSQSGRAVLGYPETAPKMHYLHHIARLDGVPVFHTMEETLDAAVGMVLGH